MTPHRWRVDCRKDRQGWRTLLSESYDTLTEAEAAQLVYAFSEDWDTVQVVAIETPSGRRGLAAGVLVRTPGPEDTSNIYL